MNLQVNSFWSFLEKRLPWVVLVILLAYSYAKFYGHPYGFRWDVRTGDIIHVFDKQAPPTLAESDRLIQIGDITWTDFNKDLHKTFFVGAKPGNIIPILVERDGRTLEIAWSYPDGPSRNELLDQLISEWFTAYFFWLAGTLTVILIRPRDERWLLMVAFNFLTAIWLIVGSGVSAYHVWYSALVLRMAIWLCVPVYLHLHWVFPRPLGTLPPVLVWIIYGMAIVLAIAQWFQLVPEDFYLFGFLIAISGSLILILIHVWLQPSTRRDLLLPFLAILLALIPPLIWQFVEIFIGIPAQLGAIALLSLPLLPLAYFYAAFRRRLGEMELRVNRFFSISLFVILLGIVGLPSTALFDQVIEFPGKGLTLAVISSLFTASAFIWAYPVFRNFVERRIFGIPLPSKRLLETYSARITTRNSLPALVRVLEEEVLPSLLIRQFGFLQLEQDMLRVLSSIAVNEEQMPKEQDVPYLLNQSGAYRSPDVASRDLPFSWARLVLPLRLGDQILGFWLFGRRDPDDRYSQLEIPILSSLANLTAIALSNILQTERLKSMYETNINRYEQERLRLALDLHDSILNELAALLIRPDAPALSPKFQQAFDELTERLRDIINDLRPPMLSFGLKLALEDFADNLVERSQDAVEIVADIQSDGDWRYTEQVENNLYRIVQQACENALQHAHAKRITIFARLYQDEIAIRIEDDGIGFGPEVNLKLDDMLAEKHFGLVGMLDRASLIGAQISLHSKPNQGTKIQVTWKSKETI